MHSEYSQTTGAKASSWPLHQIQNFPWVHVFMSHRKRQKPKFQTKYFSLHATFPLVKLKTTPGKKNALHSV
jgi:hypothetical protein